MVWDEARRLLVRQEASLDTLRSQAVAILSVASIVAGLFGSKLVSTSLSRFSLSMIAVALLLFAVTVWLVLTILTPRPWAFEHVLGGELDRLERGKDLLAGELAYGWARGVERQRAENQPALDRLMSKFKIACALTGAGVLFWALALV